MQEHTEDKIHILVVDDEPSILELICYNLRRQGYLVSSASDGQTALALTQEHDFNLIILDIMLPEIDGFELCKRLRAQSNVPLIFISAKDTEIDKVVGLELGADDYLAKPFGIRELNARVKALLRRNLIFDTPQAEDVCFRASGIVLNVEQHEARYNDTPIELTPREFSLLLSLIKDAGKLLSREELLRSSWDWKFIVETKTVDTHIKRLRDKIKKAGADPQIIETIRGYGYRLRNDE